MSDEPRRRRARPATASAWYAPLWLMFLLTALFGGAFALVWARVLSTRAVVSGPTPTPIVIVVIATPGPPTDTPEPPPPTDTPPPAPTVTLPPPPPGQISLGGYVQVTGTGGDGVHLRAGPGREQPSNYLALEGEVFYVQSGPSQADSYTWWFLISPSDNTRNGWAVSNYLQVVQGP